MIKPRGDLARKLDNYSHRQLRVHKQSRYTARSVPALTSDDAVTNSDLEARGDVGGKVLVPLLIAVVLLDVVQVIAAKNHGALHLVGHNNAAQNAATDGNLTPKGELVFKQQVRACEDVCVRERNGM